jgi:hypothetical protein
VSEDLPKDYIPAWLERRLLFYAAQQEHRWLAERLRGKAASPDQAALRREADEMVRQKVGAFPYEEPHDPYANAQEDVELEASMRNLADGYFERLRESEILRLGLSHRRHLPPLGTRHAQCRRLSVSMQRIKTGRDRVQRTMRPHQSHRL